MLKSEQKLFDAIDHAFALDAVKVFEDHTVWSFYHRRELCIKAGYHFVTEGKDIVEGDMIIEPSPLTAHHLNTRGKADIYYKNGTRKQARQWGAA